MPLVEIPAFPLYISTVLSFGCAILGLTYWLEWAANSLYFDAVAIPLPLLYIIWLIKGAFIIVSLYAEAGATLILGWAFGLIPRYPSFLPVFIELNKFYLKCSFPLLASLCSLICYITPIVIIAALNVVGYYFIELLINYGWQFVLAVYIWLRLFGIMLLAYGLIVILLGGRRGAGGGHTYGTPPRRTTASSASVVCPPPAWSLHYFLIRLFNGIIPTKSWTETTLITLGLNAYWELRSLT